MKQLKAFYHGAFASYQSHRCSPSCQWSSL